MRESEGKGVSVGSCNCFKAYFVTNYCKAYSSRPCRVYSDYEEYEFPCGHTQSAPGIPLFCEMDTNSTNCSPKSGFQVDIEKPGDSYFEIVIHGCGKRIEKPCNTINTGTYTLLHYCPDDHFTYSIEFNTCDCVEDPNDNNKTEITCGSSTEPRGC